MAGYYEQLKERIEELIASSKDVYFTDYLRKLNERLIKEKYQLDLIRTDLDRSYQMYLNRQQNVLSSSNKQQVQAEAAPQKETQPMHVNSTSVTVEEDTAMVGAMSEKMEESSSSEQTVPHAQTVSFTETPKYQQMVPQPQPKVTKRKDKEFTVGIGVFSVVGVFFVLAAFIMLGMNYMNGLVKGLLLYTIAVAVWLVSELLVRKKSYGLSTLLSSIGIAGLYISTLVNYIYLKNFNELAAGIALIIVTLLVFLVNRKKTLGIIQMASVAISTWVLMLNDTMPVETLTAAEITNRHIYLLVYFVLSMIFAEAILSRLSKVQGTNKLLYIVYGFSMFTSAIGCNVVLGKLENENVFRLILLAVVVVMGALFFVILRQNKGKWSQLFFVYGTILITFIFRDASIENAIVLGVMLLFVKLLPNNFAVRICNAVTSAVAFCYAVGSEQSPEKYIVLGAFILSIVFIRYWKTFYEVLITMAAVIVLATEIDGILTVPVVLAVLWLGVVLFNQLERFRDKNIGVYNIVVLVCAGICYLEVWISSGDYAELKIMYFILTVLGLGIIGFIFQEKNRLEKARGIVMSAFMTYMILISQFSYDITSSILLLVLGLGSIGAGFILEDKKLRIYGLVISMLVCFKITLFDFKGEELLQKMLLFLAAGIVSLIISGIYIVLDKKYNK